MLSDEQLRSIARNAVESRVYSGNVKALRAVEAAVHADMQPREVRTVEELDALPDHAVLLDYDGDVWQSRGGFWVSYETERFGSVWMFKHMRPLTVLFTPSTPNQQGAEQK